MGRATRRPGGPHASVLDLVGLTVLVAPLALGSVHIEAQLVLAGVAALGAAYVWLRPQALLPGFRVVGWTALGWLAWSLLMLIPGPAGLISLFAADSVHAFEAAAALTGTELVPSISADRPRSAATVVTLLTYGLIAATVWGRTLEVSSASTARSRVPIYIILAGALAAIVAAAHTALDATMLYGIYSPTAPLDLENLRGPMVNTNHTAALLLLTTAVTFGVLLQTRDRWRLLLLAGVWATTVGVLVLSGSRANVGLALATHGYLLWRTRRQDSSGMRGLGWPLAGAAAAAVILVIALQGDTWWRSVTDQAGEPWRLLTSQTLGRWETAWYVLLDRPLLGQGPGAFGVAAALHTTTWFDGYLSRAHNLPLQLAAEWGIPAALVLLAVGGWWMRALLRATRDTPGHHAIAVGLLGVVLQNFVDFSLLIPGVGLAWVVTAAWLSTTLWPKHRERLQASWHRYAATIACIALLAPLGAVAYDGDPRHADAALRTSARTDTWKQAVMTTIAAHPADFHLHTLGSAVALARGDTPLAHRLGQRALALAPAAPTALETAARAAFAAGERKAGRSALVGLCKDPLEHRPQCLTLLIAQRQEDGLIGEVIGTDVVLTLALAERLRQLGHREARARVLEWARRQFPDHLDVQEGLVETWLRQPEAAKALDTLSVDLLARSATELDDGRRRRLQRLGYLVQARLVEREGRYVEARHLYQEAARLDPSRATGPLTHAARVLFRLDDSERLDEVLDALRASLKPQDSAARVSYHRLRSRAEVRQGRLRQGVRELHHAIRLRPRDYTLFESLAAILERLGDERGAKRAREQADTLKP